MMTEITKPFAYCCAEAGGDPTACDCVNKNHGFAIFKAVCIIPNCRNRAPADEAFCAQHRDKKNDGHTSRRAMLTDALFAKLMRINEMTSARISNC